MTLARPNCKGPNKTLGDAWLKIGVLDKGDGQEQVTDIIWFGMILCSHQAATEEEKKCWTANKLAFTAKGNPQWVEELNDDFDDMDLDIKSSR